MIKNPKIVAQSNGIKTLVQVLLDPKFSNLMDSIISSFLYLLDDHETRKYLRKYDLQAIISHFTQCNIKDTHNLEIGKKIFCKMMKSWPGLIYLSQKDFFIQSLANGLKMNDSKERAVSFQRILME